MALPDPLPDNPMRWDGWKLYASPNPYERLCLHFDANPDAALIESNCRQLLTWWQKKLPLKNQPSNPLAQLLRSGMDEAPAKLAEARTQLLDPESRARINADLLAAEKSVAMAEFHKFLSFVLADDELDPDEEENLYKAGENLGLMPQEMKAVVEQELKKRGGSRAARKPPVSSAPLMDARISPEPRGEFLRMLRLSVLDEITDDQRDAFCNMGEALGLSGGDAEDLIDEYLEERLQSTLARPPALALPLAVSAVVPTPRIFSPMQRAEEKKAFPDFTNTAGMEMRLIASCSFRMGSDAPDALPNERPVSVTSLSAFYLARWPVTNAQYECFDPKHRAKRASEAGDRHPVVHVTHAEATQFCIWLSAKEKRRYRLPTEAEWEYAARGTDGRKFPWGERLDCGDRANFADANKPLPWADRTINCGFAGTSPVGSFPRGAGPFGTEEMAGNVWEWCLDGFTAYPGRERKNPRGPLSSSKQIYRGGSWKSRAASLRTTARAFNAPAYAANDVGFRIACECGR